MKSYKFVRAVGATCLVFSFAACQATEGGESIGERNGNDIQAALDSLPGARVIDVDKQGIPTFIKGRLSRVNLHAQARDVDLQAVLKEISPVFRADPAGLVLKKAHRDEQGDQHFRFAQFKNGLEVIGSELLVHVRDGVVFAANGSARDDLEAPTEANIDAAVAVSTVERASEALRDVKVDANPRLAYRMVRDSLVLVYVVKVAAVRQDKTPVRDTVFVNALDGSLVGRISHIHTALNRKMYDANHGTTESDLPGTLKRSEGEDPNADDIINQNYDRLGTTYDCYQQLFGRDSYDNAGAALVSSVHFSTNWANAFWYPEMQQMVYGDGDGVLASNLATSMDVTAHELTHAVTSSTSDLEYESESGGLNEALSDIFGNTCEWFRDGKVISANTWMVGEDVWTPATPGDALRYMNDPALDGDSIDYYEDYYEGLDVHYSSGLPNLAFYLLAQGGTHPRGKTTTVVNGIGIEKAAKVFYKANTSLFTVNTNFASAKTLTEQAAVDLGYTEDEIASVKAAWEAVGVGIVLPPPPSTLLVNGVPLTPIEGADDSKQYYRLDVVAGAIDLKFATSGGSGDVDLYVRFNQAPTRNQYDCRPFKSGNAETCSIANAQAGTYYVMLHGYSAYSNVSLVGSFTDPTAPCAHSTCSTGNKLPSQCDPCVAKICEEDPYCCSTYWDERCAYETTSVCKQTCGQ